MKKTIRVFAVAALLAASTTGFAQQAEPRLEVSGWESLDDTLERFTSAYTDEQREIVQESIADIGYDLIQAVYASLYELEEFKWEYDRKYQELEEAHEDTERKALKLLGERIDGMTLTEIIDEAAKAREKRESYKDGKAQYEAISKERALNEIEIAKRERNETIAKNAEIFKKIINAVPLHKEDFNQAIQAFTENRLIHHDNIRFAEADRRLKQHFAKYVDAIVDGQLDDKSIDELTATIVRLNKKALEK